MPITITFSEFMSKTTLTIIQPDDLHVHLRDNLSLSTTTKYSSRYFNRIIVMPNTSPPITTVEMAKAYQQRILSHVNTPHFTPLMTLYLTKDITPELIQQAKQSGFIHGVKLYPANATTNSQWGLANLQEAYPVFAAMEACGLPLLIHGEVTDPDVDVFDREKIFIDRHLIPLLEKFPTLRVVLEHITTKDAADFITSASKNVAATITAHHLLLNRNDLFKGGIRPHLYCLPILKRQHHQEALLQAATSGNAKFFLGTDSAPHPRKAKESACGCAGIFTAHAALEFYAEAFESVNALDKLEAFASFYGADFYGLPRNQEKITLVRESWIAPETIPLGDDVLVPLRAGQEIQWRVV